MGLNCRLSASCFSEGSNNLVMLRISTYCTPTTTLSGPRLAPVQSSMSVIIIISFGPELDLADLGTTTGMTQLPATALPPAILIP